MRPNRLYPATALAVALAISSTTTSGGAAPRKALVLSTASVGGETISCGCQKKELGGLARRAALIKNERARLPANLLVDAGDFGSHTDFEPWMRTEFQMDMMAKLGYDVVTPGGNEILEGVGKARALFARAPQIRVVSANLTDKSGQLLWPEFTLVERGGVTFAVTGVTDKSFYTFNLSRGHQKTDDVGFRDVRESLKRIVPEMRKQADVVVALLQTGAADAKRHLEGISGIDVAVVGHGPTYKFLPEKVGKTLLIQSGSRGQYMSVLELDVDGKTVVSHRGEARPLGELIPLDPDMDAVVSTFNKKYDAMKAAAKPAKASEKTASKSS